MLSLPGAGTLRHRLRRNPQRCSDRAGNALG